jgi:signal transduction histidine kinase
MHDVLAHAVSVMIVQAEAGAAVLRGDPARAEKIFDVIADAGRSAEAQLSGVLGLLKGDADSGALSPPPAAAAIPSLVDRVRRAGLAVDLRVAGTPRELPLPADVAAFRIVQEALTNSLKHAGSASVSLDWGDELAITVTSASRSGRVSHGGRGLAGIRERAAACGGHADTGPTRDGFRVHARLPLP